MSAGRPKIYTYQDEPLKVFSMRMSQWHVRRAKLIGDGNVGKGVRIALEQMTIEKVKT